jgi:hypothetical protein
VSVFWIPKSSHRQYDCFWRRTSLSYWHLLFVSNRRRRFWNTKSKSFVNMTLFEGGSRCQTNISYWTGCCWRCWRSNSTFSNNASSTPKVHIVVVNLFVLNSFLLYCTDISYWIYSYCTDISYWNHSYRTDI